MNRSLSPRGRLLALVVVVALLAALVWWQQRPGTSSTDAAPGPRASRVATPGAVWTRASTRATSASTRASSDGLATISLSELPSQAQDVHRLLAQGGPFPYSKDGSAYLNRNRLLPPRPSGYYREFTVPTPGESDRGPRRLVVGGCGKQTSSRPGRVRVTPCTSANPVYWTDDHYDSFRRVR